MNNESDSETRDFQWVLLSANIFEATIHDFWHETGQPSDVRAPTNKKIIYKIPGKLIGT